MVIIPSSATTSDRLLGGDLSDGGFIPVANFSADVNSGTVPLTVNFTDESTYAESWSWDFDGDDIVDSIDKNPVHTYTTTGKYSVNLTVTSPNIRDSEIKTGYITVTADGFSGVEGGEKNVSVAPVLDSSDTVVFKNNLYHTGVTSQAGPIDDPELVWSAHTGYMNTNPLVLDDLLVSVCSYDISVLNRTTGDYVWHTVTSGENLGTACYGDGKLFYPESSKGKLSAYDIRNGELLWNVTGLGGPYSQLNTPVVYEDHRIYFGIFNGNPSAYYCYYDNGTQCWSYEGSGYYWAGAAVIGDYLVFGGEDMNLTSLNKNTGDLVDEINVSTVFSIPTSGGQIESSVSYDENSSRCYFTTVSGYCCGIGFDKRTGKFVKTDKVSHSIGPSTSTPSVYNGRLYVGVGKMFKSGGGPYLYCLNASDMSEIWKYTANGIIQSSPTVSTYYENSTGDIYIYFTTNAKNGTVYCLKDHAGNSDAIEAWHWTPPESMQQYVLAGAVLKQGYLFFGNNEWKGKAGCTFALKGSETGPIVSKFSAENTFGKAPLNVSFSDESSGYGITEWLWDFGDNSTSNEKSPFHVYEKNGLYTVSLTVMNSEESNTSTRTGFVNVTDQITPVADFSYSVSGTQSPVSVEFTDTSNNTNSATTWFWDFGDNTTSNLQNPTHQYTEEGMYSVTLTVSSQYGNNTVKKSGIIAVEPWNVPEWATNDSWPQFQKDAQHSGFSKGVAPSTATRLWVSDDIGAVRSSSIAVTGGRIFVNCNDNDTGMSVICSLNQQTGAVLAGHGEGDGGGFYGSWSSPVYDDGKVWCGLNNYPEGTTYNSVNGGTMVADGKVFSSNWDGNQYFCFEESTGEELWNFSVPVSSYAQSCPAYKDGKVYVLYWHGFSGGGENSVYCLNADTGEEIWRHANISSNPCGSPMITDDAIYFTTHNPDGESAQFYALNITDGSVRWSNTSIIGTDSTPAYAYGNIYVSSGYSRYITYCFNATTGELVWETDPKDKIGFWTCSPAVADGKVYVGTGGSGIVCLDAYTGKIIWQDEGGGSTPAIVDGVVYSIGKDGRVYAYFSSQLVSDFAANPVSGEAPLIVQFNDTSSGSPTSWFWDFDNDGTADSTEQNPVHTYTIAGTYSVKLTSTNANGSDEETKTNYITVTESSGNQGNDTSNQGNGSSATISLTVKIVPIVSIEVSPLALDFGELPPGKISESQNLSIKNTGSCDVNVISKVTDSSAGASLFSQGLLLDSQIWNKYMKVIGKNSQEIESVSLQVSSDYVESGTKKGEITFWAEAAE
ncbi:cell surface protein [Methanosarcina spelaei]|uniref:Cell surface protein n=1 Tax=Methanosarcina spelaei TaxID=1036679 RepID=A0A2A2HWB0_9EURY|nr:cell surface protein [Methanosarcina spelaei]